MKREVFGWLEDQKVEAVTLRNGGMSARLITYGARLTELWVPDRLGVLADVVLGCDTVQDYVDNDAYLGAVCGRYANRIAEGRCNIDGIDVQLDINEGAHHLHGGEAGLDRRNWRIAALDDDTVTFVVVSEDGEMGYPGRCDIAVRYHLAANATLEIELTAKTDRPTLMNLASHSYFNLAGQDGSNVLDHVLQLNSAAYTPVNDDKLTTGEIRSIIGSPFDFRQAKQLGQVMADYPESLGSGFDHNWCLMDGRVAADLWDPGSGRRMTLSTSEPGLQVYTGGGLSDSIMGKRGQRLCRFGGIALEAQVFPCSPNFALFPNCVLRPGETYRQKTRLAFSAG